MEGDLGGKSRKLEAGYRLRRTFWPLKIVRVLH